MMEKLNEKEILLELTFAIKTGLTVEELLNQTLSYYADKLSCKAALIIENKEQFKLKRVFPKTFTAKNDVKNTLAHLEKESTVTALRESNYDIVKTDNEFHHVFKLSDYGYIILVKSQDISSEFQTCLTAVFQFYGEALNSSQYLENKRLIEQKVKNEIEIQDLMLDIASTYINVNLDEVDVNINKSLERIGLFVGADRSYIFNYHNDLQSCSNTFEWCNDDVNPEINNLQNLPTHEMLELLHMHKEGLPILVKDVDELKEKSEYCLKNILKSQGIKSLITLPMIHNGQLLGFVGFDSVKHKKRYTNKDKKVLSLFSQFLINLQLRKDASDELKKQEKYQELLENVEVGLIEIDSDIKIEFINKAHTKLFGYELSEIKGLNALEVFLDKSKHPEMMRIYNKMRVEDRYITELDCYTKFGKIKNILISAGAKFNRKGEKAGLIFAFIDNTHQKTTEKELRQAKQLAEIASKEKEKFFASISHEMRTPLNAITGSVNELIAHKTEQAEKDMLLKQVSNSSNYLLGLVNNVLDMAKINSGHFSFHNSNFDLEEICDNVISILQSRAKSDNNILQFFYDDKINNAVVTDKTKLTQVLFNFLDNALKFTNQGEVKLSVGLLRETTEAYLIEFKIIDTGRGMEEEFVEKMFDEFSTGNDHSSGTGLGMAITKKIVDLMDGEIKVSSQKNKGTTISIDLSIDKSKTNDYQTNKCVDSASFYNKNILVVEDNKMNALIIERQLKREKSNVTLIDNGASAIELLKSQNNTFDLILMDIQMPGMDGIECTKSIRRDIKLDIPIIAITANVFKSDLEYYLSIGVNNVLTKPFTENDLLHNCCKELINHMRTDNNICFNSVAVPNYNLNKLKKIAEGDTEFMESLLATFVDTIQEAENELKDAVDKNDLKKVKKILHKIKPSINDLGLDELNRQIEQIENFDTFKNAEMIIKSFQEKLQPLTSKIELDLEYNN